jgi:glycerophosphoryl diester phosphodiesterase
MTDGAIGPRQRPPDADDDAMPAAPAFLDHAPPLAIAHRGGALEAEENTLSAFEHARALGYAHVELDVHASRDGEVIVHHDPTFERMCGETRAVAQMNWSQISRLRTRKGAAIPRLDAVLEAFPELCVTIEMKSDAVAEPLAAVIRRTGALRRVCVAAFRSQRTLRVRRLLGDELVWSPAYAGVIALKLRGWHLPAPLGGFRLVQVPPRRRGLPVVTPGFVRAAHRAGIRVQVWTVDDAAEMERFLDMGVDGIMTDRPSLLKDLLVRRGQWPAA